MTVNYGEKFGCQVRAGTGKSTLFKLLLGILIPTSRKIAFKDQGGNVIEPDLAKIGYIAQDPVLFTSTIKKQYYNVQSQIRLAGRTCSSSSMVGPRYCQIF